MYSRNRLKRFLFISFIISVFIYIIIQIHQYRISIVGWEASISRNTTEYIFPNTTSILIKPDDLCESTVFLMVIVCSAPPNFEARKAVRNSWGLDRNISDSAIKLYFLLGKPTVGQPTDSPLQEQIEQESEEYKDIIQENFIDTYNNLTLKSLMLLKLVKNECRSTVSYVMKTDDDMYVNLVILVKTLRARNSTRRVLLGSLICHAKPIRDIYDKWYAPNYMYEGKVYPNYLSGTGYVMSTDVAEVLFNTALHTPLLHLEDVYLTGICAKSSGIRPTNDKNFNYKKVQFDPCIYQTLITSHYNTPMELRDLHFRVHHLSLKEMCRIHKEAQAQAHTSNSTTRRRKLSKKVARSCY